MRLMEGGTVLHADYIDILYVIVGVLLLLNLSFPYITLFSPEERTL